VVFTVACSPLKVACAGSFLELAPKSRSEWAELLRYLCICMCICGWGLAASHRCLGHSRPLTGDRRPVRNETTQGRYQDECAA
jgi:hypothetical protein